MDLLCNRQLRRLTDIWICKCICQRWRKGWLQRAADVERALMTTIRQRQLNFLGHVMRRHGFDNLVATEKVEWRRGGTSATEVSGQFECIFLFCKYWHQSQHYLSALETLLRSTNAWYLLTYLLILQGKRELNTVTTRRQNALASQFMVANVVSDNMPPKKKTDKAPK